MSKRSAAVSYCTGSTTQRLRLKTRLEVAVKRVPSPKANHTLCALMKHSKASAGLWLSRHTRHGSLAITPHTAQLGGMPCMVLHPWRKAHRRSAARPMRCAVRSTARRHGRQAKRHIKLRRWWSFATAMAALSSCAASRRCRSSSRRCSLPAQSST